VVTVGNTTHTVFVMSVNASTGEVSFDQQRAVKHSDASNPDVLVQMNAGVITLRLTVTDGDGDQADATVDVGRLVVIADDGPHARDDADLIVLGSASGNVITGHGTEGGTNGSGVDSRGADGARVTEITGAGSQDTDNNPLTAQGRFGSISIDTNGQYTYTVDQELLDQAFKLEAELRNEDQMVDDYIRDLVAEWKAAGVTLTAWTDPGNGGAFQSANFGTKNVTATVPAGFPGAGTFRYAGIAVAGGIDGGEIDTNNAGRAEVLRLEFDKPSNAVTIGLSALFDDRADIHPWDGARLEQAQWQAFDANGNVLGTGTVNGSLSGLVEFTISGLSAAISSVELRAVSNDAGIGSGENSDFLLKSVRAIPADLNETFTYTLTDGDGDQSSAKLVLSLDSLLEPEPPQPLPPVVSISVNPSEVAEDGTFNLIYTVSMDRPSSTNTTVTVQLSGNATLNTDYTVLSQTLNNDSFTLTIPAGATYAKFTVDPTPDNVQEPNETVVATLTSVTDGVLIHNTAKSAIGTIVDNDDHGQWFVSHQGNKNVDQVYKLDEGDTHTFNVQFQAREGAEK